MHACPAALQSLVAHGLRMNRLLQCSRVITVVGAQIVTLGRVKHRGLQPVFEPNLARQLALSVKKPLSRTS